MLVVVDAADKKETGLTGKWATDAVATATKQKTQGGTMQSLLNSGMNQAGRNIPSGNGRNGGFGGGGGGFGGGGGGFGGRDFAQGGFGGSQGGFGGNSGFGGQNRNGVNIDLNSAQVIEKGSSPDGVALTMTLKLDKTKLTGTVKEIVTDKDSKVEEAKVIAPNKFEFTTYAQKGNVKVATVYKGEQVDENTLSLQRFLASGKPVDVKADGTAETLVFHRGK
jgi:hypothetical protein